MRAVSRSRAGSRIDPADLPPLKDRVAPGLRALFVGINPGIRSAVTGHHFAGYSSRFWKLLLDAREYLKRPT